MTTTCPVWPSCLRGTFWCPPLEIRPSKCGRCPLGKLLIRAHLYMGNALSVGLAAGMLYTIFPCVYSYCVKTYTGHREWVRSVKVSPDGKYCLLQSWMFVSVCVSVCLCVSAGSLLASCSNDQVGYTVIFSLHPSHYLSPFLSLSFTDNTCVGSIH